jgi:hypothetical protein
LPSQYLAPPQTPVDKSRFQKATLILAAVIPIKRKTQWTKRVESHSWPRLVHWDAVSLLLHHYQIP